MPIYTNIGGGQQQLSSIYINNNGSSKAISNAYANINNSSKEIFTGTKRHWWKYYKINKWTYTDYTGGFYDSDTDQNYETDNNYFSVTPGTQYLYRSVSFDSTNGIFTLSNSFSMSWKDSTDEGDVGSSYSSSSSGWFYQYSNSSSTQRVKGHIMYATGGYILTIGDSSGIAISFDTIRYRKPVSYSSSYTLGYTDSYYPGYAPELNSNGTLFTGYGYYLDSDGYAYSKNIDDNGNEYCRFYDDYRWVYDGYHY
mgnify:CR=1 FL=1